MNNSKKLLLILCVLLGSLNLAAQSKLLKGKIITAKDNALISGATISVKGTSSSVASSSDRTFYSRKFFESYPGNNFCGICQKEFILNAGENEISIPLETNDSLMKQISDFLKVATQPKAGTTLPKIMAFRMHGKILLTG